MRIIVTGASGFIGREIIPFLKKENVELLLVGRDTDKLKSLFPRDRVTSYEDLEIEARGYDALVHLAVMNNDESKKISDFRKANVTLLETVLNSARAAGVKTFINTTTLHVSRTGSLSSYAQTKREAEDVLSQTDGIAVVNLRLPAVYGSTFAGKLAILSKLPTPFRPMAFQCLASLKPTVNVKLVASAILNSAWDKISTETIVSDRQNGNLVYQNTKRVLDITFALFVIIILWWALFGAWLAVKLTSPGPGIFVQQRVGKGGLPFTCYKFRTMKLGTKEAGTHEVMADNVTAVGRVLRKTKIDELPQVWNILKNELSLVGPRPCLPVQRELVSARSNLGVLDELGGITGWAQIQNVDMSDPGRLAKLDAEYLALRTIPLDLKIILATAIGRGKGDKVK
jgi:lipopolysaccharide/colanic/teichoic acid biosynthesis glycosyltransferase